MKYLHFDIYNYRAVKHAEVAVSNSLIPVIGINESGKTTILQAILAFDKNSDSYNKKLHISNYKNKYELDEQEGKISAKIILESEDIGAISKSLGLLVEDPLFSLLQDFYNNKTPIILSRTLPSKIYSVENKELSLGTKAKDINFANALYERLPFILYFDDFSDRVPEDVVFILTGENSQSYQAGTTEWHSILEEVFKRATDNKHSLKDLLKMKSTDDQNGLMSDIEDTLHKEVVKDWQNLKRNFGDNLAEESDDLKMKLEWRFSDEQRTKIIFNFKVEDRTAKKGRFFNITERSKGFQWFFNFIIKLKFNPKYKENQEGAIYLLDEPGSYLHTSAQAELLKKLQDISNTNTILYCTHSQYLLDPEIINIAKIKIAKKENGVISVVPFDSTGVSKNSGALTPLYQALHIKSGFFNKEVDYPVILEGITDFYLFSLLKNYKEDYINKKIDFIPGGGADHLKDLISNAIAFSKNYLVLLDSDSKGETAYERYQKHFGDSEIKRFFKYKIPGEKKQVVLEDFISENDQKRLCELTSVNDTKSALPILFYSNEEIKKMFIDNLDSTTIKNLSITIGQINSNVI